MGKERREADKPVIQRKEEKRSMPIGALSQEKSRVIKQPTAKIAIEDLVKKLKEVLQHPTEKTDALLHEGLSQFERQLIRECREDGMSDSEILEWMQEI